VSEGKSVSKEKSISGYWVVEGESTTPKREGTGCSEPSEAARTSESWPGESGTPKTPHSTQATMHAAKSSMPAAKSSMPAAKSSMPAAKSSMPATKSTMHAAKSSMPATKSTMPAAKSTMPAAATKPGSRWERGTCRDEKHRSQRDDQLAHHDVSSICGQRFFG
jgi:hypothetical protein